MYVITVICYNHVLIFHNLGPKMGHYFVRNIREFDITVIVLTESDWCLLPLFQGRSRGDEQGRIWDKFQTKVGLRKRRSSYGGKLLNCYLRANFSTSRAWLHNLPSEYLIQWRKEMILASNCKLTKDNGGILANGKRKKNHKTSNLCLQQVFKLGFSVKIFEIN